MYEASVPVFARYLRQLGVMLSLAEEYVAKHNGDPQLVLQARLSPSMYPFATQVQIAVGFAFRACAPLAGLEVPALGERPQSFLELHTSVSEALAFLATLAPAQIEDSESGTFSSQAGFGSVSLQGPVFLLQYALPNFLFHVTTAYAILRHIGVGLGKANYDGFHVYAAQP
jgi:hypothetical protein